MFSSPQVDTDTTPLDFVCVPASRMRQVLGELATAQRANDQLVLAMVTAGHDLRQRLHLILQQVELLAIREPGAGTVLACQSAKHQMRLIAEEFERFCTQARNAAENQQPQLQSIALDDFVAGVCRDWKTEANRKGLQLRIDCPFSVIQSDPHLLAIVIRNIVSNAVRHTTSGDIAIISSHADSFTILSIWDTGPGIHDDELRRVFRMGWQGPGSENGLGLGLSIIGRTAALLGHNIRVDSTLGVGTCFRLYLPRLPRSAGKEWSGET